MSTVVAYAVVVGPWALLAISVLLLALIPVLVRLVLEKSVPARDRDVSVRVHLFPWLRIEIDVRLPQQEAAEKLGPHSGDPPPAEVGPLHNGRDC